MIKSPIYLDYNATTPCDPRVLERMLPYFTQQFGNAASSDHAFGWQAKEAVEEAREQLAVLIGARPRELIFTSGATESINLALKGLAGSSKKKEGHIITCKTEHAAVLDTCRHLEDRGWEITYLDVDKDGQLSLQALEEAIRPQTIGICIMYANNETGVIHPVRKIGAIARKHALLFICDATQAAGKIPVNVNEDGIDMLAFSAHKLYGPKGVGALYVKSKGADFSLVSQQHGGSHERGLRSGTLNTPGIVGFGEAASLCQQLMQHEGKRLQDLRDRMERQLVEKIPDTLVNGKGTRLPHVSNLVFPGIHAEQLLLSLSPHLALSRGSACSGLVQQASHVLTAMGLGDEQAQQAVRISLGRYTTGTDVEIAVRKLSEAVLTAELA